MLRRTRQSIGILWIFGSLSCASGPEIPTAPSYPPLVVTPESATITVGQTATFRVSGGDPQFYGWSACGPRQYALMLPIGVNAIGQRVGSLSVNAPSVTLLGDTPGTCSLSLWSGGMNARAQVTVVTAP